MIIDDFSCSIFREVLKHSFIPLCVDVLAILAVTAGFSALGAVFQKNTRFHVIDVFCGWSIAATAMTLAAIISPIGLPYAAALISILMFLALGYFLKGGYFKSRFWLLVLFPGIAVLFVINAFGVAKWDDFSHWVPNALYIFQHDALPHKNGAFVHSVWPSYPYAIPFVTYLASYLAHNFIMQGGAMMNFITLLLFAPLLVEAAAPAKKENVGLLALALFFVTLGNPAFNASFTITNQGDTSTMVLTGILGIFLWRLLEALLQKKDETKKLALQIALLGLLFVLIKQVNLVLFILLIMGFGIAAIKNSLTRKFFTLLPLLLLPALTMHFIWHYYTATQMSNSGFVFLPWQSWRFSIAGSILEAMGHEALKKNGLFVLILLTSGFGIAALVRPASRLGNFAIISALPCIGYIAFLFVTYLGASFSVEEALRAASFYRYSTHLSLLGMTFVWLWIPALAQRLPYKNYRFPPLAKQAAVVGAVLLLPLALLIHATWLVPQEGANTCAIRKTAFEAAAALPPEAHHMAIIDVHGDGLSHFMTEFELALFDARTGHAATIDWDIAGATTETLPTRLFELKTKSTTDAVLVLDRQPGILESLNVPATPFPLLLTREKNFWQAKALAP